MFNFLKDLFRGNLLGGLRSGRWPSVRKQFLKENPTCAVCGTKKNLECHHVVPYHIDKNMELLESNLLTLCRRDHLIFGHLDSFRSFNSNVKTDSGIWYNKIKNRP